MDFDYKNKHNAKFHQALLKKRKSIRYSVVGAPKNPFEAASTSKYSETEISKESTECDGNDDLPVSVEKGKDTLTSTPSDPNADKPSDLPQLAANHPSSSSPKRYFAESDSDHTSDSDANERQHKRGKLVFSEEKSPSTAPQYFPASLDGTCRNSSGSDSLRSCGDFSETAQTNTGHQNLSSVKEDYELVGMLGEIVALLEDAKALNESFEGKDYCKVEFMASVNDFVTELKEKSGFLLNSCKEAIEKETEKVLSPATETVQTESRIVSNDPAERRGIQLTEQEKNFLVSKGPHQPVLKKYPVNNAVSISKQNSFSAKWYQTLPFLEYSPSLDRAYCFACNLFGDDAGSTCAETGWSRDGVNRWDKMKSRGTSKKGKLLEHFTSASHKRAVERLEHFRQKNAHVDVTISSAAKQKLAQEEQERLQNKKVINILLDCCRYLSRQALAFRGGDNDNDGNFKQLVNLLSRWVPLLRSWVANSHLRPHRVTYLSPQSQNEFINVLGREVRKILIDHILSSGVYAVMADTTPDVSHVDQISLIIRYVDEEFQVQERLLKISEINVKTGDGFAEKVVTMLNDLGLPLIDVRFQCYDTTASMSGAYNGAQAKLSERLGRSIPYITCLGHKTNLCVEHSCKDSLMIEEFFTTLQDLYNFLTKSTTRFGRLKRDIEALQEGLIMKNLPKRVGLVERNLLEQYGAVTKF